MSSAFFLLFFAFLNLPSAIQARADDDTESINTSFKWQIKKHYFEKGRCEILVPVNKRISTEDSESSVSTVEWVEATAAVEPPYKLPTCLKEFYAQAHLSGCGKPLYNKFKYCAKALFFRNKDYNTIDFKQIFKQRRQILVLVDGCLACQAWPERATNVTIEMKSKYGLNQTSTKSDRFGDFKIGEIFTIPDKVQIIRPMLEIVHYCNQYNMMQKQFLKFPILEPKELRHLTFESLTTTIPLYQQNQNEATFDLLG